MPAKKTVKIEDALDRDANSLSKVVKKAELWLQPIAAAARVNADVEAAIYFASRHKKDLIDADNLKESWYESICENIEQGDDFAKLSKEVKKRVKLKIISLAEASEVLNDNHTNSLSRFFTFNDDNRYFIDAAFFRAVEWFSIGGFEPWLDSLAHYVSSRLAGEERFDLIWKLFFWCRSDQAINTTERIALQSALWVLMNGSFDKLKPWKENKDTDYIPLAGILPFIWHRVNPSGLDDNAIMRSLEFLFQTQTRSGGWSYRSDVIEPDVVPTCVAIHGLAMAKPRGWKQISKKASEWLMEQQTKSGYWHEGSIPTLMITVLVLDSINLANNSDIVTFRMSNRINHLQEEKVSQKKSKLERGEKQEVVSVEAILSYNKTTAKFRFGSTESAAISKTSRHKARNVAGKLMKWWKKGKPCPLSEFGINPTKKTPTHVYDNISDIRKILADIEVNMPQCTDGEYYPPIEPEHFNIISRKLD